MDRIAFRVAKVTYADSTAWGLEAVINGRPLHERTVEAPLDAVSALWPGHRLWLDEPPINAELVESGRVAVTQCTCGLFGCGGTSARIEFGDAVVTWSDLTEANYGDRRPIGPFTFRRRQYESALEAVSDSFRSTQS